MIYVTFDNKKKDDLGSQTVRYLNYFVSYLHYSKINKEVKYIHSPAYGYPQIVRYSLWQNNRILDDDLLKILNPYLEKKRWKKADKDRFLESAKKYKDRVVQWDKFINYSDSYINILDIDLTNFNIFNNINPNEINNFNKKTNFLIVNPKFNINEDNNKLLKVYKPYLLKKYYLTNNHK